MLLPDAMSNLSTCGGQRPGGGLTSRMGQAMRKFTGWPWPRRPKNLTTFRRAWLAIAMGYSVPRDTVDLDPRPGGHERFVMINDADPAERYPMDSIYSEAVEKEVLAGYQDAQGLPGAEGAVRMEFRLEFHDEPDGRTRLELRAVAAAGNLNYT